MTALDSHQVAFSTHRRSAEIGGIPRLKEFQVKWSATVQAEGAKSAVRRLWASHFKPSDHDRFTVYCGQTKKNYRYQANTLAPELNKSSPGGHVYRVTWEATLLAENEADALRLAKERLVSCRPDQAPRVSLGIHDRRGGCLTSERAGLHDILRLVK